MSHHTPGPWTVTASVCRIEVAGTGQLVAFASMPSQDTSDVGRANARLIAAAPEMFEALKDFMARHQCNGKCHENARALLAKVEGK